MKSRGNTVSVSTVATHSPASKQVEHPGSTLEAHNAFLSGTRTSGGATRRCVTAAATEEDETEREGEGQAKEADRCRGTVVHIWYRRPHILRYIQDCVDSDFEMGEVLTQRSEKAAIETKVMYATFHLRPPFFFTHSRGCHRHAGN